MNSNAAKARIALASWPMFLRESPAVPLPPAAISPYGNSEPHENRAPVLAINYIISLYGVYPSPS